MAVRLECMKPHNGAQTLMVVKKRKTLSNGLFGPRTGPAAE